MNNSCESLDQKLTVSTSFPNVSMSNKFERTVIYLIEVEVLSFT